MTAPINDSAAHFKQTIKGIVERYKKAHLKEYVLAVHAIRTKAASLEDTKFGTAKDSHAEMRALYEIPETLNNLLIQGLSMEGLTWLSTKPASRWFAKTYKEFALAEEI